MVPDVIISTTRHARFFEVRVLWTSLVLRIKLCFVRIVRIREYSGCRSTSGELRKYLNRMQLAYLLFAKGMLGAR